MSNIYKNNKHLSFNVNGYIGSAAHKTNGLIGLKKRLQIQQKQKQNRSSNNSESNKIICS